EFPRSGLRVVRANAEAAPALRLGLDAVGIRDASASAQEIEASLQLAPARKRQHRVDAIRRQFAKTVRCRLAARIDDGIGAKPADYARRQPARRRGEHARAMAFGKLHGECTDRS